MGAQNAHVWGNFISKFNQAKSSSKENFESMKKCFDDHWLQDMTYYMTTIFEDFLSFCDFYKIFELF